MARYMLDTNICIYLMKRQPESVARRFEKLAVGDVVMSAITYAELEFGVAASLDPGAESRNLAALVDMIEVAPFGADAGSAYGKIRLATRERKRDALDKLIAAHAVALNSVLVTHNERDFQFYPGLRVENWIE